MTALPVTLSEAAAALRRGDITSVELTETAIARADRIDGKLGSYLYRCDEAALAAARRADKELRRGIDRGPLHGITVAIKDVITTADCPTTAQSVVLDPTWGAGRDAPVVATLRSGGAVIMGKTTTMEYAIGLPDPTKPFPVPRNPWNLNRWAGGSSSGTANGVAAGLFLGGVGTDTGGSIRMPAALCGVTGFKPTFGLVPKTGVVPLSWSFDHVGPIARSAEDCSLLLAAMAHHEPADPYSLDAAAHTPALGGSLEGVRIGVLRDHHVDAPFVDPVVITRFEESLGVLAGGGADVVPITIPAFDILIEACPVVFMSEALTYHRVGLRKRWFDYGASTRLMVASGLFYSAADYIQANRVRRFVRGEVNRVLTEVDLIATPTVGAGAPAGEGLDFATALSLPVFTPAWSALGLPAISVPNGFTADRLPTALQLVGRAGEDATVLRVADAYQRRTDWHLRRAALGDELEEAAG